MGFKPGLSLHSHALCFLHEREASLDGVRRVSGGRAHHQVLSEGRIVCGSWGSTCQTRAGHRAGPQLRGVASHQGKCTCTCPLLVFPDEIR